MVAWFYLSDGVGGKTCPSVDISTGNIDIISACHRRQQTTFLSDDELVW